MMKQINEHDLAEIKKCLRNISDFVLNKKWLSQYSKKKLLADVAIIERLLGTDLIEIDTDKKKGEMITGSKTLIKG